MLHLPPYFGLRDYGMDDQIGNEQSPEDYVMKLINIFHEVKRVLSNVGTLWLNLGDSYARNGSSGRCGKNAKIEITKNSVQKRNCKVPNCWGLKHKDLMGIPWRVAFALQKDGWYLRQDIIWHKRNPMPESVTDRCTRAHEYIFLFSKNEKYYFNHNSMKERASESRRCITLGKKSFSRGQALGNNIKPSGNSLKDSYIVPEFRNKRSVWTTSLKPYKGAHFATFPPDLIEPCILAGCPVDGIVLDPFAGTGTVGEVSESNLRNSILIELNPEYVRLIEQRLSRVI